MKIFCTHVLTRAILGINLCKLRTRFLIFAQSDTGILSVEPKCAAYFCKASFKCTCYLLHGEKMGKPLCLKCHVCTFICREPYDFDMNSGLSGFCLSN